ncbi:HD domain-containing protein [Ottowia sp. GY511]|uniref:HD domain-containing protein n=1 Tax=Ottowia flava TaxID=2675430 RepID=A0ABW4KPS6_9BURK|nr:HD domain-containing protein [Ottowia sp. GY511]TXK23512.1 HD domain-containing protein [Ottowia sp. GY511]
MLRPKEVARAAVIVFGFWWIVLLIAGGQRYASLAGILHGVGAWAFGIAIGCVVALFWHWLDRQEQIEALVPDSWNGAAATIGKVPIHRARLAAAEAMPTVEELAPHMPPEVVAAGDTGFLHEWIQNTRTRSPGHAALLEEIVRTLWHERVRAWPATHADDPLHNHGGRTLLTHSLLVCWLMLRECVAYSYVPARAPSGYQMIYLRDANYSFDRADPLIAVLGLGHDLGKIECYVWVGDALVDCTKDHDLVGARIMARMEGYWHDDISAADIDVMQAVLAHYHHPSAVPMAADGGVLSDRLHALLELLIKCDRMAGAMENGRTRAALREDARADEAFVESNDRSQLHNALVEVLTRVGRVNSQEQRTNVGVKFHLPHFRKTVVALKEDAFIQQIAEVAGLQDLHALPVSGVNPVNALTRQVLIWMGENGLLFTDHEPMGRAPESSLYKVSFYKPKDYFTDDTFAAPKDAEDLARVKPVFSWGSCILLAPEPMPELAPVTNVKDYWLVPHFSVARTGGQGAFRKKSTQEQLEQGTANNAFLDMLGSTTAFDEVSERADEANGDDPPQVQAAGEGDDQVLDQTQDQVAGPVDDQVHDLAQDQVDLVSAADDQVLPEPEPPPPATATATEPEPDEMIAPGLFRMRLLAAAASKEVQRKDQGEELASLFGLESWLDTLGLRVEDVIKTDEEWRRAAQIVAIEHKLIKALGRVGLVVTLRP